jgi:uncharacterized protein YecT (DUF1311 family)
MTYIYRAEDEKEITPAGDTPMSNSQIARIVAISVLAVAVVLSFLFYISGNEKPVAITTPVQETGSFAPSFNCAKASTRVEHLICNDRRLAALDVEVDRIYKLGMNSAKDPVKYRNSQREWLKNTRNRCDTISCLIDAYELRDLETRPRFYGEANGFDEPQNAGGSLQNTDANSWNFLIGLCSWKSDDDTFRPTTCNRNVTSNTGAVGYTFYKKDTVEELLLDGKELQACAECGPHKFESISPITYTRTNNSNEVMTTVIADNGCILQEIYKKEGTEIFDKPLPFKGPCTKSQFTLSSTMITLVNRKGGWNTHSKNNYFTAN